MKSLIFSLCFLLLIPFAHAQDMQDYATYIEIADSLYEQKEYAESARNYSEGFATIDGKAYPNDRYKAAEAFSLSNQKEDALYHLKYLADKSADFFYQNMEEIIDNESFKILHQDEQWKAVVAQMEKYKEEVEKDYNWELKAELDSIYEEDQGLRRKLNEVGFGTEAGEKLWGEIAKKDSTNEIRVAEILDQYGWLGQDIVGKRGNATLFLVIQHAPLEVQLKYLPMMKQAVKDGKANASALALLVDRTELRQGRKQIYGSQIITLNESDESIVQAMIAPDSVNIRRAEVGLGPIEEYVARFGIKWDLEEYKKQLPELEERLKQK